MVGRRWLWRKPRSIAPLLFPTNRYDDTEEDQEWALQCVARLHLTRPEQVIKVHLETFPLNPEFTSGTSEGVFQAWAALKS